MKRIAVLVQMLHKYLSITTRLVCYRRDMVRFVSSITQLSTILSFTSQATKRSNVIKIAEREDNTIALYT